MASTDFMATAISGSITRLVDGKSYLVNGSGIEITSASLGGQVKITATGGGGGSEWTRSGNTVYPNTPSTTDVKVGGTGTADSVFFVDTSEKRVGINIPASTLPLVTLHVTASGPASVRSQGGGKGNSGGFQAMAHPEATSEATAISFCAFCIFWHTSCNFLRKL
jgi:hypothetical protein